MATGRRSDILLGALGLVVLVHGALFGLAVFGLLALVLKLFGQSAPSVGFAIAFGALAGLGLLALALHRQRALRETRRRLWGDRQPAAPPLLERFQRLVAVSALARAPELRVMESARPSAFAVGRSEEDAAIVVTSALLELLDPVELDAVLAHEIAQVESGAIREIGFADAIADSVGEIGRLRSHFLWGPKKIYLETEEVWDIALVFVFLIPLMRIVSGVAATALEIVCLVLLVFLLRAVIRSLAGLAQASLFLVFLGPLTVIEAVLTLPLVSIVSRLISRTRVYEADARSVELTGQAAPLVSALEKLEGDELRRPDTGFESELQFSLFASPFLLWDRSFPRLFLTHPEIQLRIDAIESRGAMSASLASASG